MNIESLASKRELFFLFLKIYLKKKTTLRLLIQLHTRRKYSRCPQPRSQSGTKGFLEKGANWDFLPSFHKLSCVAELDAANRNLSYLSPRSLLQGESPYVSREHQDLIDSTPAYNIELSQWAEQAMKTRSPCPIGCRENKGVALGNIYDWLHLCLLCTCHSTFCPHKGDR